MAKKKTEPTLEENLGRLEEIAGILDRGDVPLEEQLALYSEGMKVAGICRVYLESAELRISKLSGQGAEE